MIGTGKHGKVREIPNHDTATQGEFRPNQPLCMRNLHQERSLTPNLRILFCDYWESMAQKHHRYI
jgi:hypothetical protein